MSVMGEKKPKALQATDVAWRLMCNKGVFTSQQIADELEIARNRITNLTNRLLKQAVIEQVDTAGRNRKFRVCTNQDEVILGTGHAQQDRKPQVYKKSTGRQQIWNSIRINRKVDRKLIQVTTTNVSKNGISAYLKALADTGYLKPLNSIKGGAKSCCLRFMLMRDSGRFNPIVRKNGVWDQNTQTFYPFNKGTSNE